MNYYQRYCGDYARDTGHLSLQEHGAYTVMLDTYYATETALPADYKALYRICRAMSGKEQEAVRNVANKFFPVATDGLRHNGKADEVIEEARPRINAAKENGKLGGRPKKEPIGLENENPVGLDQKPGGKALQHQHQRKPKTLSAGADFSRFYDAYPRKEKRHEALKAFAKINPDASLMEQIMAALERQKSSDRWLADDGKYIPLPPSWLNGKRWEDEGFSRQFRENVV